MSAPRQVTFALIPLVVAVFLVLVGYFLFWEKGTAVISGHPVDKSIRLSYELQNDSSEFIEEFKLISYLPLGLLEYQNIISINSNENHEIVNDGVHNSLKFNIANLPPYGRRTVSFTATVQVYDSPKYQTINKAKYLKSEKYIESEDPEIVKLAGNLRDQGKNSPKDLYRWVRDNIHDAGYIAKNMGAKYAIVHRKGDCTEYMYAFIALARANGIPARGVAGFVVDGSASLVASSDYHNWAEYYDGEKWVLVDPYKGHYDEMYQNYIAFRFLGTETEFSASRFVAVDKRVSVRL